MSISRFPFVSFFGHCLKRGYKRPFAYIAAELENRHAAYKFIEQHR